MTFSIVAWDPGRESAPEWGVAVASKFLAVGAVVPWAQAGAGALATQSYANVSYGPDGLARLEAGEEARSVVEELTGRDRERQLRQLGMVDARGEAAAFTGADCFQWAGDRVGRGYCCQGNILTGAEVLEEMAVAYEHDGGDLAGRLVSALAAGDRVGGDRRGKQSAALLVVREGGGYLGGTDVAVDLRVDDHSEPVEELGRLLEVHRLLFPRPEQLDFLDVDEEVAAELRASLVARGYQAGFGPGYDADLEAALFSFVGTENLESRWSEGPKVERRVLELLRSHEP